MVPCRRGASAGVRAVAVAVRDGAGQVRAAVNVTVHAAETSPETLITTTYPYSYAAAGDISATGHCGSPAPASSCDPIDWTRPPQREGLTFNPPSGIVTDRRPYDGEVVGDRVGLLTGVQVLEVATVISGPYARHGSVDYGAEVTKIGRPAGIRFRYWGGTAQVRSLPLRGAERGKRASRWTSNRDDGRRVFLDMCADADVVLENFRGCSRPAGDGV